ncbi:MAG: Omp28-related outer membrane protein [Flavobacteriales bacterium]|nr:Omp28-related outer membrane protein [Flavobacteriales bacterium]
MNRIFTLLVAVVTLSVGVSAQSNKMLMIEEGTQASCGPCAAQNPAFDAMLEANNDKVVVMKYQTWWPGYDPMYLDNTEDVAARINYYGINGVPTAVGNGEEWANDCGAWPGAPACLSQDEIDAAYAEISPLTMDISAELVNGILEVSGTITADMALSGNLKLRIALTEQTITYEDAPGGTNGETEYNHVMKAFLGGAAGISLDDMAMGDVYIINETMAVGGLNIYNYDQLEVVAFVQDDTDKTVHQAAKDQSVDIVVDVANNATAGDVSGLPVVLCAGTQSISPVFTLINGGNEALTSADITYTASGGASMMMSWTGNIPTFGSEDIALDPIDVVSNLWNEATIHISVDNPNGATDDVDYDNDTWVNVAPAPESGASVEVSITTDAYGDEVYWEMRNGAGEIIAWGGNPNVGLDNIGTNTFPPPSDPDMYGNNTTYTEVVDLTGVDCFTFHITDYYGDGLLGSAGYTLKDSDGNTMHDDSDDYQVQAMKDFSSGAVGLTENELASSINIGPNPANDILNVRLNMDSGQENVIIEVMNSLGQMVHTQTLGAINGASLTEIDVKGLENGLYYVNVIAGEAIATTKVTVAK